MTLSQNFIDSLVVFANFFLKSQFLKTCEYVSLSALVILRIFWGSKEKLGNPDPCLVLQKGENE